MFSTVGDVLWRLALLGVGAALFQSPISRALMSNTPSGESGVASSIIVTTRNLGMVFAVCFAGILLNTAISPVLLQQSQLFNLAAYNFTTGMHRVVLLGAILSVMMAGLSLIGFNKYGTIVEDAENIVKKQRIILEKRVSKQIHQISMVFK
jgi:MFS family permease